MVVSTLSLAHAEVAEDGGEDFIGGDFAGDFAKVMEGFAYVLREEVAGVVVAQSLQDAADSGLRTQEGFVVALVGYHDVACRVVALRPCGKMVFEGCHIGVGAGGYFQYGVGGDAPFFQCAAMTGALLGREEVGFVDEGDEVLSCAAGQQLFRELLQGVIGRGAVDSPKHDVGLFEFAEGAVDAHVFDGVAGVAYAGGVDETEGRALYIDGVFKGVAGRPVYVGHEGAVVVKEPVEEGRFSRVGFADDNRWYAVFQGVSAMKGIGKTGNHLFDVLRQFGKSGTVGKLHIFFTEIEFEFDEGNELQQLFPQGEEFPTESAPHLVHRQPVRGSRFGGDEVGDGFGLGEVEFAVCECAAGKFARHSAATAFLHQQGDKRPAYVEGAVAGYFDGVFAGERVGCTKERYDHLVERRALFIDYLAVNERIGGAPAQRRFIACGAKNRIDDSEGIAPADAHDGYRTRPRSGGEGTNGIAVGVQRLFRNSIHRGHIVILFGFRFHRARQGKSLCR